MKLFCHIILMFFVFIHPGYAQDFREIIPEEVLGIIAINAKSDLSDYEKLVVADSLYDLLKEHYEYLGYEAKFKLAKETKDSEVRIFLFKTIRNFPYYLANNSYYGYKFYDQYVRATYLLINEYKERKDLQALYDLNIVPSATTDVYGMLRKAIEAIGGFWDKGDFYYPVPKGTREIKH
jgi:hypothetical protein